MLQRKVGIAMRTIGLAAWLALAFAGCDHDYAFKMQLLSPDVPDSMNPMIPANDIATLQVDATAANGHPDDDDKICVDITVIHGRLICPGFSCFTAGAIEDGGTVSAASHVFLNLPVGAGPHVTYPVYQSPADVGEDVITGDVYQTDCQTLVGNGGRLTGTAFLSIDVLADVDMSAPATPLDMGAASDAQ